MRTILGRNEELRFTLVAYGLLVLVTLSFLSVRFVKESHAKHEGDPKVLSLYPPSIVPGALERVTVLSDRTHFGPGTTVSSQLAGVFVSNVRFTSEREMSFEVYLHDRGTLPKETRLPLVISSPKASGIPEQLALELKLSGNPEPLELDLFNFEGKERVVVDRDYVMLGYRPRGYAPYRFSARLFEGEEIFRQETSRDAEFLGVPLKEGENRLLLTLSDALGREVRKQVTVESKRRDFEADSFLAFARASIRYALTATYTGKPTQWGSDPSEQMAASDCVLGNGPLGCAGGCGSSIRPPPNDYLASLGQAEVGGEGVLLHNGQYRDDTVDLYIPGRGLDFVWRRSYQSGIDLNGYLGKNWDFSWGAHFKTDNPSGSPGTGRFSRGDGRRDQYTNPQASGYDYLYTTFPTGYVDIECRVNTNLAEVQQTKRNGFKQCFDRTTGNLKTREDRYGNKITVYYDYAGKISTFKDTLDRYINVYYGAADTGFANAGRLTKITDFASRSVQYEYAEAYSGGPVVLTKVLYPPTDWKDDTTNPWTTKTNTSRTVQYEYDSSYARLTREVDGRGKERLKSIFDGNGRVDYQYNYSSGSVYHDFTWTLVSSKVNEVLVKNRSTNERKFYFDTTNHLSTKREVKYTPQGDASPVWATWSIIRGCSCTLSTEIKEPDYGYTKFTINSNGDVTEKREYYDNVPGSGWDYTQTAGSDLVRKAYFAAVTSSEFGVCTKIVGPKAFTATPNEDAYAINIGYDTVGNPTSITYPNTTNPTQTGHVETREYNAQGQLVSIARPEGMLTSFTYYGAGDTPASNLGYLKEVKVKYKTSAPNEFITVYTYSNFGARTKVKDPLLRETSYVVDNEFLVKQVTTTSPFSYIRNVTYNGSRALLKEELENRKGTEARDDGTNGWWETQHIYNDAGVRLTLKREISESGGSITWQDQIYAYDNDFRQTLYKDPRGKETLYTLDERGFTVTKIVANSGNPQTTIKQRFDAEGKLEKAYRAFRNYGDSLDTINASRHTYDVFDREEYVYDGQVDLIADNYKRFFYDLASMATKAEERASDGTLLRQSVSYFDEMDRLWKRTRGTSEEDVTTFEYDLASRQTKVTDDNSNSARTEYDLAGRTTKSIRPTFNGSGSGENYELYEYDLNSNVTKRTSHEVETPSPYTSADFVWEIDYDELNRRTKTTHKGSDGATGPNPYDRVQLASGGSGYDTRDLTIRTYNVDGVPTEHEYDGLGRRTKTTHNKGGSSPSEIVNLAAYDLTGNVTSRTDAESNVTTYAYDDQNHLTKVTHADGDFIEYVYNLLGSAMTKRYGNGTSYLKMIEYRYDLRGLLRTKNVSWTTTPTWASYDDYKTTKEEFTYDGVYRLTNADDNDAKVTFAWNALDELTSEKLNINRRSGGTDNWTGDKTTTSTWDDTGRRRTSVTYPISGKKFEYTNDALNRVTEIALDGSPDKPMVRYWYEGPGRDVLKRERGLDLGAGTPNTFRTSYSDDALGRLTQIKHQRITGSTTDLRTLDYTWGNGSTGRIFQRSTYDTSGPGYTTVQRDYLYDNVERLVEDYRTISGASVDNDMTYGSTQFWNDWKKDGGIPAHRAFTKVDGSLQMTAYTNPTTTCSFDLCGNMATQGLTSYEFDHEDRLVYINQPVGSDDYWFRYDALGRRVEEKVGSTVTLFFYDGVHIAEETDSSLGLNRLSIFGVKIDEVLYSGDTDGGGALTAHRWPFENHLGSVILVTDDGATVKSDYTYTAFGEATNSGGEAYPYLFTGRRSIGSLTLLDYRTRAYEPGCGRFLQRDRVGIWKDRYNLGNGYAYVGNNPMNLVDPNGHHGLEGIRLGGNLPELGAGRMRIVMNCQNAGRYFCAGYGNYMQRCLCIDGAYCHCIQRLKDTIQFSSDMIRYYAEAYMAGLVDEEPHDYAKDRYKQEHPGGEVVQEGGLEPEPGLEQHYAGRNNGQREYVYIRPPRSGDKCDLIIWHSSYHHETFHLWFEHNVMPVTDGRSASLSEMGAYQAEIDWLNEVVEFLEWFC